MAAKTKVKPELTREAREIDALVIPPVTPTPAKGKTTKNKPHPWLNLELEEEYGGTRFTIEDVLKTGRMAEMIDRDALYDIDSVHGDLIELTERNVQRIRSMTRLALLIGKGTYPTIIRKDDIDNVSLVDDEDDTRSVMYRWQHETQTHIRHDVSIYGSGYVTIGCQHHHIDEWERRGRDILRNMGRIEYLDILTGAIPAIRRTITRLNEGVPQDANAIRKPTTEDIRAILKGLFELADPPKSKKKATKKTAKKKAR